MNTSNLAHRYGRELFSAPGRPIDIKIEGCHHLIFQYKAQLLSDLKQLIHARLGMKDRETDKVSNSQSLIYVFRRRGTKGL